jgi:nucleotide-binding universal stress UspA family protein
MYKHILLPVDDSTASQAAIASCMDFAQWIGAQVTALHVQPDSHALTAQGRAPCPNHTDCPPLAAALAAALAHDVRCAAMLRSGPSPHAAILKAAHELRCDLIAMGSHGRMGLHGLVKGSETRKVLLHSTVPVLVFRSESS